MVRVFLAVAAFVASVGLVLAPNAMAEPTGCTDELDIDDPYGLIDADVFVDFDTYLDIEDIVNDYTPRIDDAVEAEDEGLEPPEGESSDELIDDARADIADAIDVDRLMVECAEEE